MSLNHIRTKAREGGKIKFVPWWWKALFYLLTAGCVIGGFRWYQREKKTMEALITSQLEVLSNLKVEAIKAWILERKGDAHVLSTDPTIKDFLLSFNRPISHDVLNKKSISVIKYLNEISESYNYDEVLLTDSKGRVLISVKGTKVLDEFGLKALENALKLREPIITEFHFEGGASHPHLGVVVGVEKENGKALGGLFLKVNVSKSIYRVLELMPIANKKIESILVKKDGNEVLFLSELQNRVDAPLRLRIPLTHEKNIAVMAVKGAEGFVEGSNYQGKLSMAFVSPIPGSTWKLITQIETGEIFGLLSKNSLSILAIWGISTFFFVAAFLAIKEGYKKAHFRELNRLNERLGVTLRSIGDAVIATDMEGRVEMLNPVAEQLTGFTNEEAMGKELREIFNIINEETRNEVENPVARVLREGVVVGLANHTLLISRDFREIPIADSGAPIITPDGNISGVVLVFRDQSKERKAKREIKEAKEFAESIVATVREALVVLDASLKIVSANRYFYSTFRVTPEESEGKLILEIANRRLDNPKLRQLLENILPSNSSFDGFEVLYEDEFGENKIFLLNARRLHSESGETKMILLTLEDITERRRYESELIHTVSLLQATLDSTEDGILLVDKKGKVSAYNKKFLELWRIPEELAQEKDDEKLLAFVSSQLTDWENFIGKVRELYDNPNDVSFDEIHFKDGRIFERYSQPHRLRDEIVGRVWSFRDVTEKRKALELAFRSENLADIGKLAVGVAHDFNNKLQIILTTLDIVKENIGISFFPRNNKEQFLNRITKALEAVNRCKIICTSLLALGHQQSVINPEPMDLKDCVLKYHKQLGELGRDDIPRKIDLTKEPLPVLIDPYALERILINLVSNGLDAIVTKGEIQIKTFSKEVDEKFCESHPEAKPGKYAVVSVSDTGCGMDEKTLARIFEPFFTTKEKGKGSGIGLATVLDLVTKSNGFITVVSDVGKGATFEVHFPFYVSNEKREKTTRPPADVVPKGEDITILVVENEELVLESVSILLEAFGYTTLRASSPTKAIEKAKEYSGEIHVLLTDVSMPEMNGKELFEAIKKLRPNMKCLYMSGYPQDFMEPTGVTPEGVDFILKPFESTTMRIKIHKLLYGDKWQVQV